MKLFYFFIIFTSLNLSHAFASEIDLGDVEWIHLYHDQPMYFLLGSPETKVQFSFKEKIVSTSNFYIAYTQRMFWDLFAPSAPFIDINYNPSVYYRIYVDDDKKTILDLIPIEHESNGKNSLDSRSWNRVGARYLTTHRFDNGFKLLGSVRAWVPFSDSSTNPDLAHYRGIYEIEITLSDFLGKYFDLNDLCLRFYSGGQSDVNPFMGGQELTLRLKGHAVAFLANAVFQIFQGYAENMLNYRQKVWGMRAGFGI